MQHETMRLVEECAGEGELSVANAPARRVRYRVSRYQGVMPWNGMPIPGLHRIEGTLDVMGWPDAAALVGACGKLRLEDGRTMPVTVTDASGHILTEGHGPSRCSCC